VRREIETKGYIAFGGISSAGCHLVLIVKPERLNQ
jgi:hypothetical protein